MSHIKIITELIKQGHPGTQDLYSKIPFFLRTRLDAAISEQPWAAVSEGCEQHDPISLERASQMYQFLLNTAEKCIKTFNKNPLSDCGTLMLVDKYNVESEFQNNAVRFVSEMAKCLKKEKELVFIYHESEDKESDTADHADSVTSHMEDDELEILETLIQEADNLLKKARKSLEDQNKCLGLSMEIFHSLQQGTGHVVDEINQDDEYLEGIRHYSAEMQNIEMNHEHLISQYVTCKQKALESLNEICLRCSEFVEKLLKDIQTWKAAEAKRSVKVGPETDTGSLINKFSRFGNIISNILTWFTSNCDLQVIRDDEQNSNSDQMSFSLVVGKLEMDFQNILSKLFHIIVTSQPKGVISIENKGKKDTPNYCTKKTQPFSTTVRILAGECFQSFHILSKEIELVAEKDLAQGSTTAVAGKDGHSCLKVDSTNGNTLPDIQFNLEVKNFCRLEQNNVYKQFFRLLYKIKVSVNGNEYTLMTMSLPFTFNTGANQILEHMGARMWYCGSVPDLYNSGFQCPDPLLADDVISMLDNRVTYLGNKTRRLTESEKSFLKGRLPVASDGTVTMQGFLKDKMKNLRSEEALSFPFYTWFYSVVNSIEELLLQAWQDGIIYGFCSEKTAEEVLMKPEVPEGSFILRPSVSQIKKTSSADAKAGLVMEVKLRNEDAHPFDGHKSEYSITSIPLFYKHIEKNTLYQAIKGIESDGKPLAKFLYGRDGGRKLDVLKDYVKRREHKYFPGYRVLMEKIEKFNIRKTSQPVATAEEVSEDDDSVKEPTKRKRRYRKSSSQTQNISISQSSPMSSGLDDSPGTSSILPIFTELSSGEKKPVLQENSPKMQFQSNSAVNEPRQRSGPQGKNLFGTSNENAVSGNMGQSKTALISEWIHETPFGNVQVDVSQICKRNYSPLHCQSGHISPESVPNISGNASFGMISLDNNRATAQVYGGQFQDDGINNNCFTDAARSPACHNTYNIPVQGTNYPFQNMSPACSMTSSSESSVSSPGSIRLSPSQLNVETTANLPTVLSEASDSRRQTRRRGNTRGSINRQKSPVSSRAELTSQVWMPNTDQNTRQNLEFIQNHFHCQVLPSHIDQSNYNIDDNISGFTMDTSLNLISGISLEIMDESQLTACIIEQQQSLQQLSPDSGLEDQSPSPIYSWGNNNPM